MLSGETFHRAGGLPDRLQQVAGPLRHLARVKDFRVRGGGCRIRRANPLCGPLQGMGGVTPTRCIAIFERFFEQEDKVPCLVDEERQHLGIQSLIAARVPGEVNEIDGRRCGHPTSLPR